MSMTVDEFVETKVLPEFRPIVAAIRSLMKEAAPTVREVFTYGAPMWVHKKVVAWITPSKSGVSLGFQTGAYFEDRYGLLRGTGKHARNVRMKSVEDVNKPALEYYIKQALKHED
jgi:hypothetical protein